MAYTRLGDTGAETSPIDEDLAWTGAPTIPQAARVRED
jgi:hypothetical protein